MKKKRIASAAVFLAALALYLLTDAVFPACLMLCIALYTGFAAAAAHLPGGKIKCRFSKGTEVWAGEMAEIKLYIENGSFIPVFFCIALIKGENMLSGSACLTEKSFFLPPKGKREYSFGASDPCCGLVKISLKKLYASDGLGLFKKDITGARAVETEHFSLPRITELPVEKEELDRYHMESCRYSEKKKGNDPSEVFGIRSYVQGDSIKGIHWKLSGKIGEIVIREYALPVDSRIFVMLDKRAPDNAELTAEEINDTAGAFVSLLYTLAKKGIRHSAGWYDYLRGEYEWKEVASPDDIYALMPLLLGSPFRPDTVPSADRFLEAGAGRNYGSYIYVTARGGDDPGLERLREYGEVIVYMPQNFK